MALVASGLEDMSAQFPSRQRPWFWDGGIWSMVWMGMNFWSCIDYIMVTDNRLFRDVSGRYPKHNPDHYMILGCLCRSTLREHTKYLRRCTWISLRALTTPMREGGIFAVLWRAIPKPKACKSRKNAWILEAAWRLVNTRVSASQDHVWYQYPICILSCLINAILEADQRWRTE